MIQTISFSDFCDSFSDTYKNNFTYEGKRALFDYFEQYESELDEQIELDTIGYNCEAENEAEAIEYLQDKTQVIEFDGGIIIADF